MERIKSNVSKETGDRIREYNIPGVKVDEDSKGLIRTMNLHPKSWVLQERIIRELSDSK